MIACISEPVSWLRLEQAALGTHDAAVEQHLATCAACRACLDEIRGDVVALPALQPVQPRKRSWLTWAIPSFGVALAAAAALLVISRPQPEPEPQPEPDRVTIKGIGEVTIGTVRDRADTITDNAPTFRAGDRWKVVVTCPPLASAWLDVAITDDSSPTPDYPLAAVRVACGNRVVIPGAFELTGTRANRICAVAASGAAPSRGTIPAASSACVTIRPE